MKFWQLLLGMAALVLLAVLIVSILPGNSAVFESLKAVVLWIPMALWSTTIIVLLFFGPSLLGALYRIAIVPWVDERVEQYEEMGGWKIFLLGFSLSLVVGALWIAVAMLSGYNPWVAGIFKSVGWEGYWEVAPIGWGIFGFLASLIGIGIGCIF